MTGDDYDARKDAHDSYFHAVEVKRLRGDKHWPDRKTSLTPVDDDRIVQPGDFKNETDHRNTDLVVHRRRNDVPDT